MTYSESAKGITITAKRAEQLAPDTHALAEARQRWGASANAGYNPATRRYWVVPHVNAGPELFGYGDSWEAAFADAEKRNPR